MGSTDRRPLQGTPTTARISAACNNRLGSVYSALYAFWSTRAAIHGQPGQATIRRDAYSVVLFDNTIVIPMQNDFQSSPNQLLDMVLRYPASGGTNFNLALSNAQAIMERHWSTDRCVLASAFFGLLLTFATRTPVVVFLSDGECSVNDAAVQDPARRAIALGYVAVCSIGVMNVFLIVWQWQPLFPLRRFWSFQRYLAADGSARQGHPEPGAAGPDEAACAMLLLRGSGLCTCAFTVNSLVLTVGTPQIRLAETFLGIADSLRKPRGSLMKS
jgi:hypothetical protein